VTWYAGAPGVKTGFDINYVKENLINCFRRGITYPNINAIASDCPQVRRDAPARLGHVDRSASYTSYNQAFDLRGQGLAGDIQFPTSDYNWFIQDNWRLNNQLTLNLGVRWEYQKFPQPTETETNGVKFTGNPAYPATVTFNQDKNNFGPRVGFAYACMGTHTTVVRGGWVMYYGRSSNSVISSALTQQCDVRVMQLPAHVGGSAGLPEHLHVAAADRSQAVDSVSLAITRASANQHGGTDDRSGHWQRHHGFGVVSLQRWFAPADVPGHEPEPGKLAGRVHRRRPEQRGVSVLPGHSTRREYQQCH
jgi:hypothetical protein